MINPFVVWAIFYTLAFNLFQSPSSNYCKCPLWSEVVGEHGSRILVVIVVVKYLKNTQRRDYFVWKQNVLQRTPRVTLRFITKWQRQCVHCCQPDHITPRHCTALTHVKGRRTKERLEQMSESELNLNLLLWDKSVGRLLDVWLSWALDSVSEQNVPSVCQWLNKHTY